jgi:hypothetical protein
MSLAETSPACFVNRSASPARLRASSTNAPRVVDIERGRREAGISQNELLRRAGLSRTSWCALLAGARPKAATLARLQDALQGQIYTPPQPELIRVIYRLVAVSLGTARGVDAAAMVPALQDFATQMPNSPGWLKIARVRQLAIYVLTVELLIANADVGRAIGCSRQNIKKARTAVEDRREIEPELDALIERVAAVAREAV